MRWRSIMSIEPRSLNRPSTSAGSGVLCASRPSMSGRPKANSNRSGVHSAPSSASFSSQIAQVLRHRRDLVLPDAIDRGAEAVVFAIVHLADRGGQALLRAPAACRPTAAAGHRPAVGAAPPPASGGTDRRASADPSSAAAPAPRAARAGRPPPSGTDTGTRNSAAARSANTAARRGAARPARRAWPRSSARCRRRDPTACDAIAASATSAIAAARGSARTDSARGP